MIPLANYKIAVFTRSANYLLYKMANKTLNLPFKHYRFTFTNAHGYIYKILKYDIDYAVNIDEDAFVVNNEALVELLKYCIEEEIVNCGMRDGGVLPIRYGNPVVTNPFFNILDVRRIRRDFSKRKIKCYPYQEIDYDIFLGRESFPFRYEITSDYEPYYPFFLWLNTNYKVYYLDAVEHKDKYTTVLLNQKGEEFLYHSWYSRAYGKDDFHTRRINELYYFCGGLDIKLSAFEQIKIYTESYLNKNIIPFILPVRRRILQLFKLR
jgi:hypothetical protein